MAILRMIKCDIKGCTETCVEPEPNAGWMGWGMLQGIVLNGAESPSLCPTHLRTLAKIADNLEVACHGMD
ncbi:MAG: hypothetical protein A2W25_15265 [candidate division Zixibacteria bacterium RBG_16_53_22]|nr:MAG: hypothetical protein A2W25_15265 [candidate division Zixibacteria bacterium RBG_16_53_22]